jgi:hypothetical protein
MVAGSIWAGCPSSRILSLKSPGYRPKTNTQNEQPLRGQGVRVENPKIRRHQRLRLVSWRWPEVMKEAQAAAYLQLLVFTLQGAQTRCGLDECAKYFFHIQSRLADDLKHVGSGGLLLHGLAQFVEQARVLDCDDSLFGKICNQVDLFVAERADLLAEDADCPNRFVCPAERQRKSKVKFVTAFLSIGPRSEQSNAQMKISSGVGGRPPPGGSMSKFARGGDRHPPTTHAREEGHPLVWAAIEGEDAA